MPRWACFMCFASFDIPTTAPLGVQRLSNPQPIKRRLPFDAPTTPSACARHKKVPRWVHFVFNASGGALTPPDTPKRAHLAVFCHVQCPSPHGLCPSIDAEHKNAPRWAGFRVGRLSPHIPLKHVEHAR